MKIVLVAVALLACAGTVAAEQFYKWKDSAGTWHYTTTPPPDGAISAELNVDPDARSSQPEAAPTPAANAADAVPADAVAKRRLACDKARAHLTTLTENPFIQMDKDGDGTPEMLTEAQQAEEVKRTTALVEGFCDPA
jgi:hypothetical protein